MTEEKKEEVWVDYDAERKLGKELAILGIFPKRRPAHTEYIDQWAEDRRKELRGNNSGN